MKEHLVGEKPKPAKLRIVFKQHNKETRSSTV